MKLNTLCENCRWATRLNDEWTPVQAKRRIDHIHGVKTVTCSYTDNIRYEGFYCPFSRKKYKKETQVVECNNYDPLEVE